MLCDDVAIGAAGLGQQPTGQWRNIDSSLPRYTKGRFAPSQYSLSDAVLGQFAHSPSNCTAKIVDFRRLTIPMRFAVCVDSVACSIHLIRPCGEPASSVRSDWSERRRRACRLVRRTPSCAGSLPLNSIQAVFGQVMISNSMSYNRVY